MLADIAHFHLFSRDRERGIMDSLRYQANEVNEPADRGICGADVGRERGIMDNLRFQANLIDEVANRGIYGTDVGRERGTMENLRFQANVIDEAADVGRGVWHHGQSQVASKCGLVNLPIGKYVGLMLADIAHFHLFSRDRERGIMSVSGIKEVRREGNMWRWCWQISRTSTSSAGTWSAASWTVSGSKHV